MVHVCHLFYILVGGGSCDGSNVANNMDWDKFDTIGRGFLLVVGPILELYVNVQRPLTIYPRVIGPHCIKRLANGVDYVLHCLGANVLTTGADVSTAVLDRGGFKDWDKVLFMEGVVS